MRSAETLDAGEAPFEGLAAGGGVTSEVTEGVTSARGERVWRKHGGVHDADTTGGEVAGGQLVRCVRSVLETFKYTALARKMETTGS